MKKVPILIYVFVLMVGCSKEVADPFLLETNKVRNLTDSSQVRDLKVIFAEDSISRFIGGDEFTGSINDIEIYEKGGKRLLVLTPFEALDSSSTIKTIRIIDPRFKTPGGLSVNSNFGDINNSYEISGVQNTLRNLIISVDEINAYFTIDKNELPANMRYDMTLTIDPIQIPDKARIKDFYMQWY